MASLDFGTQRHIAETAREIKDPQRRADYLRSQGIEMPRNVDTMYPPGRAGLSVQGLEVGPPAPSMGTGAPIGQRPAYPESGPPLAAGNLEEVDPAQRRQLAESSAEAVRNTSAKDKEAVNREMSETFGEDGIVEAYKEMIERLGGEKEIGDLKLSKQDMGLFLMDFGMRMMAYASQGESVGGAIGQAGVDTLGQVAQRKTQDREATMASNEETRRTALGMAEYEMDRKRDATDQKNIIWTSKGAYNMRTGEYVKGPEGGVLQPGMAPGASNRPFASQYMIDRLTQAGYSDEAATAMAQGARHPAEIAEIARQEIANAIASGETVLVGGERIRARNLTAEQRDQYIQEAIDITSKYLGGPTGGPALTDPGPQAEGRN